MPVSMGYQEGLYDALLAPPRSSLEFKKVDRQCHEQFGRQLFDRMFAEHDLDVLIAPADALSTLISAAAAYIIVSILHHFRATALELMIRAQSLLAFAIRVGRQDWLYMQHPDRRSHYFALCWYQSSSSLHRSSGQLMSRAAYERDFPKRGTPSPLARRGRTE